MSRLSVLVAAEWLEVRKVVIDLLHDMGHWACPFEGTDSALRPDVVISDAQFAERLGEVAERVPVVLMSGEWTPADVAGASSVCLAKPFNRRQLAEAVERAAQGV